MKNNNFNGGCNMRRGFTLVELLVVITTIAVLAALLLPALTQTNKSSLRTQCVNNLKLINFSFHAWEGNQGGKYPTAVSVTNGGAMENIYSQSGGAALAGYGVTNVFCVMSNQLGAPTVLACPADFSRTAAMPTETGTGNNTPTGPLMQPATNWASFGNQNLSYFVEGNASDKYPQMILVGDRNIGQTTAWTTPAPKMNMFNYGYANAAVRGMPSQPKLLNTPWEWTDLDLHQDAGNLGMADGSVQSTSLGTLQAAFSITISARGGSMNNTILNMP